MRGPAPTPTKILDARGSWRAKTRSGEPKAALGKPTCPKSLGKEAKAEWRRVVKHLEAMGLLAQTDRAMLTAYCEAWGEFVETLEAIKKAPSFVEAIEWGLLKAKNDAAKRILQFAQHFGLSPAARARLGTGQSVKPVESKGRFFPSSN